MFPSRTLLRLKSKAHFSHHWTLVFISEAPKRDTGRKIDNPLYLGCLGYGYSLEKGSQLLGPIPVLRGLYTRTDPDLDLGA